MRPRPSRRLSFLLLALASALPAQRVPSKAGPPARGPGKKATRGKEERKKEKPPVFPPRADKKEARAMLKAFKKNLSRAAKSALVRREVIQALVQKAHPSFVGPLEKLARTDKSKLVRAAAVKALGKLDFPRTRKALLKILGGRGLTRDPLVLLAGLDAVERLGYHPAFFQVLSDLFEKTWDMASPGVPQQKIIRLFAKGKEKRAFRLLVDHLDEPRPADVNSASNPPASWWEKRWKAWHYWRGDVKAALREITGVEFTRAEFYKKWARRLGGKRGIKY